MTNYEFPSSRGLAFGEDYIDVIEGGLEMGDDDLFASSAADSDLASASRQNSFDDEEDENSEMYWQWDPLAENFYHVDYTPGETNIVWYPKEWL